MRCVRLWRGRAARCLLVCGWSVDAMRDVLRARIFAGPSGGGLGEGRARRILSVMINIFLRVVVVLVLVMVLY